MRYAFIVLIIVALLFPIYWMFVGSLMDIVGTLRRPPVFWPPHPTLQNYRWLLEGIPLLRWSLNTVSVTALMMVVSVTVTAMAGYAFATQRGVGWLYWLFLVSVMVPRSVLIIPTYVLMRWLGISGTRLAAVLPAFFFPVGIFLFKAYVDAMPKGMIDCARIDGAGERQLLVHVITPLAAPIVATLAVMKFIEGLTDYLWQMLVLQDPAKYTLMIGLLIRITLRGGGGVTNLNPIGIYMATGVLLFLPLLAIFAAFQRYFIDGIMNGGVKE